MSTHPLLQIDYLLRCLKDANPNMRVTAAKTLKNYGDERAILPLIEALGDEYPEVKASAAYALGSLADSRAIEPLLNLLEDPTWDIQCAVNSALGRFPHYIRAKTASEKFNEFLKTFPNTRRRFTYEKSPDVIKAYLLNLNYPIKEKFWPDNDQAYGFEVCDTTVTLGYDLIIEGKLVATGGISVNNSVHTTYGDIAKADRSLKLYLKLYRRFRQKNYKSKLR